MLATAQAEEAMPVLDELRAAGVVIEGLVRQAISLEDLFMETVGADTPGAAPKSKAQPPALK